MSILEVERILAHRTTKAGKTSYLIKWLGYGMERASWEPEASLVDCQESLVEYRKHPRENITKAQLVAEMRQKRESFSPEVEHDPLKDVLNGLNQMKSHVSRKDEANPTVENSVKRPSNLGMRSTTSSLQRWTRLNVSPNSFLDTRLGLHSSTSLFDQEKQPEKLFTRATTGAALNALATQFQASEPEVGFYCKWTLTTATFLIVVFVALGIIDDGYDPFPVKDIPITNFTNLYVS